MEITAFGLTDVGKKRARNEDAYLINQSTNLYIVADGMGGHLGGEIASRIAVSTIEEIISKMMQDPDMTLGTSAPIQPGDYSSYLKHAISVAGSKIFERATFDPNLHGMGTTVVAVLFAHGKAYIANVGDSRCYLLRSGSIKQLTEDHSLVSEQIRAGIIKLSDARGHKLKNIITRSVGFQDEVDADVTNINLKLGDRLLLCTDGLTNMLSNDEISVAVAEIGVRPACEKLIELANERGGDDNITVVMAEIEVLDEALSSDETVEMD